ncbi:MAG: hypothetical protein RMM17_04940 [Acidobacteriota bacterium]|nr:hypothetical protein [Blastocatellia bacterium]MDW8412010.1 hypothetical protein [Acidobacteriota bacterium]
MGRTHSVSVSRWADRLPYAVVLAINVPVHVWVAMVLLTAAALCYSITLHTKQEYETALRENRSVARRLKDLEIENKRLELEIEAVEKDPRTIEVLARRAGLVAADEAVILIKDAGETKN